MKKIKLIAVDMDGTLLNDKKEMPSDFIPWVKSHPDIHVVIASGRQYETLRLDFEELENDLYFLADNGAFVFYQNEMLYADTLEEDVLRRALERICGLRDVFPILCGAKCAYMNEPSAFVYQNAAMYYKKLSVTDDLFSCIGTDMIPKVACFFEKGNAAERFHELSDIDPTVVPVLSGDSWIDVLHVGIDKGSGVRTIQEKFGIRPEECMAFGDYMNDYGLLKACKESYAMENAHPDLKKIARHIAPSNEEEGVMQVLRRLEQ